LHDRGTSSDDDGPLLPSAFIRLCVCTEIGNDLLADSDAAADAVRTLEVGEAGDIGEVPHPAMASIPNSTKNHCHRAPVIRQVSQITTHSSDAFVTENGSSRPVPRKRLKAYLSGYERTRAR
jgi:hypothetical protein